MKHPRLFAALALMIATGASSQQHVPQATASPQPVQRPLEPATAGATHTPQCATHHTFNSRTLQREMSYCIILPADYANSQRSYPVLYLLHGLWGSENDWLVLSHVEDYARSMPLIIVMPQADDSWYTNSATTPANRYEDFLFQEFVQQIESSYRVRKERSGRFLAGLSMGGYGALKGAVKYPRMFAAVGAFSASLRSHEDDGRFVTTDLAFGKRGSATRRENDVFPLLAKSEVAQLPYIFETCGARDDLEPIDLRFAQMLRDLGAKYEYHEFPGGHEWPVWDLSLRLFLDSLVQRKFLAP